MPFGGQAFEEFVGEYFRFVKNCIVEVHVDYCRKKQWTKMKQDHWSDIDVLAIDHRGVVTIVSCAEHGKEPKEIVNELSYAEKYVSQELKFSKIAKCVTFVVYYGDRAELNGDIKFLRQKGIDFVWFSSMVKQIIEKIRRENKNYTGSSFAFKLGKFTEPAIWVLRELDLCAAVQGKHILPQPLQLSTKNYLKRIGKIR